MPDFLTPTSHFIFAPVLLISTSHVFFAIPIYVDGFKMYNCNDSIVDQYQCNDTLTGEWPTGAEGLQVQIVQSILRRPNLHINWTSDMKNVRCFQIVVKRNGDQYKCLIKNYTQEIVSSNIAFIEAIQVNDENHDYEIKLYTWPQPNATPIVVRKNLIVYDCTQWRTHFQYFYDGERIKVIFVKAPKICEFKRYSVTIQHGDESILTKIVDDQGNSSTLTTVFSLPLCKGFYYIEIRKAREKADKNCKDIYGNKPSCSVTTSIKKMFIPRVPCPKDRHKTDGKTNTPEGNDASMPLLIACGLFIIFLPLQAVYVLRYLQTKRKRKGIVLFVDDHPAHIKAVNYLVDYLRTCHLDIIFASRLLKRHNDNRFTILVEAMKSDFVLLITSFAFHKRIEAWRRQQDYIEFFKEKNSSILSKTFLEKLLLQRNFFVCSFDHVNAHCYWPKFYYSVPSCLEEMVVDLAGGDYTMSTFKYFFKKKILLTQLDDAVRDADHYECRNFEWFYRKYFCPKVIADEENSDLE